MNYFDNYVSNSSAGISNQKFFTAKESTTGRIFFKLNKGGTFPYSFYMSNTTDSTFADGSESRKNIALKEWNLESMRVAVADKNFFSCGVPDVLTFPQGMEFKVVTFSGEKSKTVKSGEYFTTDEVTLTANGGDYLVIEMTFCGDEIPYQEETIIPSYRENGGKWEISRFIPAVNMIGCKRQVKKRIAFFGDSITQGLGTEMNSYTHWNYVLSRKLGDDFSYWNIGIGYGRADDAATSPSWMKKAEQCDTVFLCFGVNDIQRGFTAEQIENNLNIIVDNLKGKGKTVILQNIPPFNYNETRNATWKKVNKYIEETLSGKVDFTFYNTDILKESDEKPQNAKYGGHPNAEGCRLWAEALYNAVKDII